MIPGRLDALEVLAASVPMPTGPVERFVIVQRENRRGYTRGCVKKVECLSGLGMVIPGAWMLFHVLLGG